MARKSLARLGKLIEGELTVMEWYITNFANNKNPMVQSLISEFIIQKSVYKTILRYIEDGSEKGFYLDYKKRLLKKDWRNIL